MSITDLGAQAAQESQSNSATDDEQNEYERFPLDDVSFGMQHPTTAVRGTAVALRPLWDEDDPDRSDVAVILDDPSVILDDDLAETVVVHSTKDSQSDDWKVVNLDDAQTERPTDDMIDFAGNTFYGDIETEFGDFDRIALKRGGGAGTRITKTLDTTGDRASEDLVERDEDGTLVDIELGPDGFPAHNGGLMEYDNREDGDEYPRRGRDPQIRPDVEGQEVVIMIQRLADIDPDYNGDAYWATVFASLADDRQQELAERYAEAADDDREPESFITELDGEAFIRLQPTDEFEADDDLIEDTGWNNWTGIDRDSVEEIQMLNSARIDAEFGSIYVPEGMTVEDATPDNVDPERVTVDPEDDDWSDDTDAVPVFGAGATEAEAAA